MNLYEIATEYRIMASALMDAELDEQTKADTLEGLDGDLIVKATNIVYLIRELEGDAEMAKAEAKRISDLATVRANAAKRLKEWLTQGLVASGKDEIVTASFTAKLKKNPPAVVINNEDLLTDEFKRTKIVIEPNKVAIADAIKKGQAVPGAHLEQKMTVSIK